MRKLTIGMISMDKRFSFIFAVYFGTFFPASHFRLVPQYKRYFKKSMYMAEVCRWSTFFEHVSTYFFSSFSFEYSIHSFILNDGLFLLFHSYEYFFAVFAFECVRALVDSSNSKFPLRKYSSSNNKHKNNNVILNVCFYGLFMGPLFVHPLAIWNGREN